MPRVVVVGGGVAGLAAALRVLDTRPDVELTLVEASPRTGGIIRTEVADGYVLDRGPESILTEKPAAMRTIARLGLEPRLVRTEPGSRGAFVVAHGKLERIPEGFQLLAPTDLAAWLRTPYVSLPGRLRALLDLVLPARDLPDETLGSFVERRLGREVLERLAQPLVGGIYGAHPDVLGLAASMPRFLEAERAHRSVILGLRARARATSGPAHGARYGLFVNFDRGMQVLVDAMADSAFGSIRTNARVAELVRSGSGFSLTVDGRTERADAVVLASAAAESSRLVAGVDPGLAESIAAIRHGSGAIVTLAYPRDRIAHPLDSYGYVTPTLEGRRVVASTFLSRKWPGRSPTGVEAMRFFVGRDGDDEVVGLDDETLAGIARDEAASMLGASGAPLLVRVDRWRGAMPRFGLGHLDRVAAIEARVDAIPGLGVAGNAYRGVGIPDSIASGESAADRALRAIPA